jgi:glycyl-tRNA synthetase alpha subunit
MEWKNVRDYHQFVFLAIDKDEYEEIMNDDSIPEKFKQILKKARDEYKWRQYNKKYSSVMANRKKTNMAFRKCAAAAKRLIDRDMPITAYQLKKEAGVHFNTAKKFIEKYEDDIKEKYLEYIFSDLGLDGSIL